MISQFITFQKMIYRKILSCQIVRKWIEKVKKRMTRVPENLLRNIRKGEKFMKGSGIRHEGKEAVTSK